MIAWTLRQRWWWAWSNLRLTRMVEQRRYEEALELIATFPNDKPPLSWRIRTLQINHFKGNDGFVVEHATELVRNIRASPFLKQSLRNYLVAYVALVARTSTAIDARDARAAERAYPIDYSDVDLKSVPGHWRRDFPLTTHPQWNVVPIGLF